MYCFESSRCCFLGWDGNVSCHRWLLREEPLRYPWVVSPCACTCVENGCVLEVDGKKRGCCWVWLCRPWMNGLRFLHMGMKHGWTCIHFFYLDINRLNLWSHSTTTSTTTALYSMPDVQHNGGISWYASLIWEMWSMYRWRRIGEHV